MDNFAQIAANGIGGRQELLVESKPSNFEKKICKLTSKDISAFTTNKKISTKEELYSALK